MYADEIIKKIPKEVATHKELSAIYCEQVFGIKASLTAAFGIGDQKFGVFKISDKNCFPSVPKKVIDAPYLIVQFDSKNKVIPTRLRELKEGDIYIIGREHEGNFALDKKVSRKHVEVGLLNGVVAIKDLGSRHGTKDIFNEIQLSIVEVAIPIIQNEIKNIFLGIEQNQRKNQKEQKARLNKEVDRKKNDIIGQDNKVGLYGSRKKYSTSKGAKIIIASDKGIGSKDHNEDRVVVVPDAESVSVIDGVGGNASGDIAAQILAENLSDNSYDIEESTKKASKGIDEAFQQGIIEKKDAAAAFISARIIRGRLKTELEYSYSGDCSLIVISQSGKLKHISKQDSYISSSLYAKNNGSSLSEDELLYHPQRNIISHKIDAEENKITTKKVRVKKGDMVILMSDGISDNLTPEEIAKLIKGQNPEFAVRIIDLITSERMKNYEDIITKTEKPYNPRFNFITNQTTDGRRATGKYSDGFKSMPKRDNRGIAIMEV